MNDRKCHCGRDIVCPDTYSECTICRTRDHAPDCKCDDCIQAIYDKDWERQLNDYHRASWDYWSYDNE